jgi:hypothetical protein
MIEEATNGNPWAPTTVTLRSISKAAFELDDYRRIIEILHKRYFISTPPSFFYLAWSPFPRF